MSRKELPFSQANIAPFDLEAFVQEAAQLGQRALEAFAIPFPKAPDRWLSHDQCRPRPIECTAEGEVEGGRSWLIGSTLDVSFTRSLLPPTMPQKAATATIRPAPASWRWPAGGIATPTMPDAVRICASRRKAAVIERSPVFTMPCRERTI